VLASYHTVISTISAFAMVMKTFGNVAGHTGQVRKPVFARRLRRRPDVRDHARTSQTRAGTWTPVGVTYFA